MSTAEITSLSKRIFTAERPGCIGGRPAPGRGPPSLLFFLVATLVLSCFGGGILESGTETQRQEQYRPQVNDVPWEPRRRSKRNSAKAGGGDAEEENTRSGCPDAFVFTITAEGVETLVFLKKPCAIYRDGHFECLLDLGAAPWLGFLLALL